MPEQDRAVAALVDAVTLLGGAAPAELVHQVSGLDLVQFLLGVRAATRSGVLDAGDQDLRLPGTPAADDHVLAPRRARLAHALAEQPRWLARAAQLVVLAARGGHAEATAIPVLLAAAGGAAPHEARSLLAVARSLAERFGDTAAIERIRRWPADKARVTPNGPPERAVPAVGAIEATAPALTPTEDAVVRLVLAGRSNPEVAAELFVSRRTVESHLGRIYKKLGVSSRLELIRRQGGRMSGAGHGDAGPVSS